MMRVRDGNGGILMDYFVFCCDGIVTELGTKPHIFHIISKEYFIRSNKD